MLESQQIVMVSSSNDTCQRPRLQLLHPKYQPEGMEFLEHSLGKIDQTNREQYDIKYKRSSLRIADHTKDQQLYCSQKDPGKDPDIRIRF